VLGQLARWFYRFGSGAHCNNYYTITVAFVSIYALTASAMPVTNNLANSASKLTGGSVDGPFKLEHQQ
jgi:hypothetical protein